MRICLLAIWVLITEADSLSGSPSSSVPSEASLLTTQFTGTTDCWTNGSLQCLDMPGEACPPGMLCQDGSCICGVYPYIIRCTNTGLSVADRFCDTYDSVENVTVAGSCLFTNTLISALTHYPLPRDVLQLNDSAICKTSNRTGRLCGRCLPDHYPLAYSFNMTCIPCPNVRWNWVRYIMAAYIPLTLFYMVILFLKINTTSSHLFPVVF